MPIQEPVEGIIVGQSRVFTATPVDAQGDVAVIPGTVLIWTSTNPDVTIAPSGFGIMTAVVSTAANIDTTVTPSFFINIDCNIGTSIIHGQVNVPLLPIPNISPVKLIITENS